MITLGVTTMKIVFTDITETKYIHTPEPALKNIPDWYKNTSSYLNGNKPIPDFNGNKNSTIKKCMPVFDALTAGYLIKLPVDLYVSHEEGNEFIRWSGMDAIGFHPVEQASLHPNSKGFPYPKFISPWSIKTPKGYSCLFITPMHRDLPFTILPGIVDTDTYNGNVNFPFVINDKSFNGLIPSGTPFVQIIPFKRDSWKMNIGGKLEALEAEAHEKKIFTKFFDGYKTMFRSTKEYK